ncbi:MAG: EF-hand domain-containing protein [Gammaproteobacteria bacterium]
MISSISGSAALSAAMASSTNLRPTESAQEKVFARFDVNHDGGVDQSELSEVLSSMGSSGSEGSTVDTTTLFQSLDSDSNGTINGSELESDAQSLFDALRAQLAEPDSTSQAARPGKSDADMLAKVDLDGDGSVDQNELSAFLDRQNEPKADDPKSAAASSAAPSDVMGGIAALLAQYRSNALTFVGSSTSSGLSVSA